MKLTGELTLGISELEKLGPKYRVALMSEYHSAALKNPNMRLTGYCLVARDERWTRLTCDHKGTYADDVCRDPGPWYATELVS